MLNEVTLIRYVRSAGSAGSPGSAFYRYPFYSVVFWEQREVAGEINVSINRYFSNINRGNFGLNSV